MHIKATEHELPATTASAFPGTTDTVVASTGLTIVVCVIISDSHSFAVVVIYEGPIVVSIICVVVVSIRVVVVSADPVVVSVCVDVVSSRVVCSGSSVVVPGVATVERDLNINLQFIKWYFWAFGTLNSNRKYTL